MFCGRQTTNSTNMKTFVKLSVDFSRSALLNADNNREKAVFAKLDRRWMKRDLFVDRTRSKIRPIKNIQSICRSFSVTLKESSIISLKFFKIQHINSSRLSRFVQMHIKISEKHDISLRCCRYFDCVSSSSYSCSSFTFEVSKAYVVR